MTYRVSLAAPVGCTMMSPFVFTLALSVSVFLIAAVVGSNHTTVVPLVIETRHPEAQYMAVGSNASRASGPGSPVTAPSSTAAEYAVADVGAFGLNAALSKWPEALVTYRLPLVSSPRFCALLPVKSAPYDCTTAPLVVSIKYTPALSLKTMTVAAAQTPGVSANAKSAKKAAAKYRRPIA